MTLQPGQSYTQNLAWYGTQQDSSTGVTGTFVVSNAAAPQESTTLQIVAPLSYSISTDQTAYQFGEPIQITFTGTNTSDEAVTVSIDPSDFIVTQYGGLTFDWHSNPTDTGQPTTMTLQPGQSYTQTATWDGIRKRERMAQPLTSVQSPRGASIPSSTRPAHRGHPRPSRSPTRSPTA